MTGSAALNPPCTSNGQTGCVANASFLAGAPAAANANGPNGVAVITPPAGYYNGVTNTITADDTNLVASHIASGVTIFGVSGSAILAPSNCSANGQTNCVAIASYVAGAPAAANTNGANGATVITPPAGYYDGATKTVTADDTNLIASNILMGKTIFGVGGTVTAAYGACSDNALNAGQCSTAASRYVSPTLGSAISGANGSLSATITQGFYDGTKSCSMSDTNLIAGNILTGKTIFGVAGSVTAAYGACSDNALNAGQCSTATSRYVTPTLGSSLSGANASLSKTITEGFYDGTTSCSMSDTNLAASNIASGVAIFGVTGSATLAYSACTDNALNAGKCSTSNSGSGRYVTATLGSAVSGANASLSATIPLGYYDGTKSCSMSDTNLVAANIASGVGIFGVTGTATLAPANCSSNGQTSCVAVASYVAGAPAAANTNGANGATVITPPAGYYNGTTKTVTANDTNLVAGNIIGGVSIFGVTGSIANNGTWNLTQSFATAGGAGYFGNVSNAPTATEICSSSTILGVAGSASCGGIALNSNVYRNQATSPITQSAETTTYAGAALPAGLREVPDITEDDDGYVSAGVTSPQVTLVTRTGWGTTTCGTTQTTIAARIANCASVFAGLGSGPTWNGATLGNAGQATWKLVTRTYMVRCCALAAIEPEVWQDQNTGLLWSSLVTNDTGTTDNWCRAAGNGQTTGNGYAANDPSGYCNNSTYQPNYVNNTTAFNVQSWCAEVGPAGVTLVPADSTVENWGTPTYSPSKGAMGKVATASSPSVRWRLPTKYDYQLADNDGIRFVMPEMANTGSGYEWSASVYAASRASAWIFNGARGHVDNSLRSGTYGVRCVGR